MKKFYTCLLIIAFVMSLREIVNVMRYNEALNPYGTGYIAGNAVVLTVSLFAIYWINKNALNIRKPG